jgi:hypothetical protein
VRRNENGFLSTPELDESRWNYWPRWGLKTGIEHSKSFQTRIIAKLKSTREPKSSCAPLSPLRGCLATCNETEGRKNTAAANLDDDFTMSTPEATHKAIQRRRESRKLLCDCALEEVPENRGCFAAVIKSSSRS